MATHTARINKVPNLLSEFSASDIMDWLETFPEMK